MAKRHVIVAQMGTPKSPKVSDVRRFLRIFLGNPRVVGLPRLFWFFFLRFILLPFYAPKSANLYARLWDGQMFLSRRKTLDFSHKLKKYLGNDFDVETYFSFMEKEQKLTHGGKALILFPQYCESTHGVLKNEILKFNKEISFYPSFHLEEFFIKACVQHIDGLLAQARAQGFWIQKLILSFHNMPLKQIKKWDDPYLSQCQETYKAIKARVKEIESKDVHIAFQSRMGRGRWAQPETKDLALKFLKKGDTHLAIFCPSFIVDGIESVDEIGFRLKNEFMQAGGELLFIPCLNDDDDFIADLAAYLRAGQ